MAVSVHMTSEKTGPEVGPLRKNSTGCPDIKANEAKVLPNYLRASTGSCHDFCKYGTKRDFTMQTRTTMPEKLPVSPNKGREPDKSNNMQKQKRSFCTSRSALVVRSSVRQVREKEIQSVAKKVSATARCPHKSKMQPLETKGAFNCGWKNGINTSKQTWTCKGSKKLIWLPATCSLSHKREVRKVLKEASHLKNQDTITTKAEIEPARVEDIPEKMLFITELNSENHVVGFTQGENICDDSLQCPKGIQVSLASLLQETEDVSCIDKEIDPVQFSPSSSSKENICSRIHERGYSTESSSSSLVSLLSSNDNNGSSEAETKSLGTEYVYCESDGNENESIKIVLQHQNIEQKRSNESLFNDVIEETATKLVTTRKSKVKALIGAFETVISLQEVSLQEQLRHGDLPRIP